MQRLLIIHVLLLVAVNGYPCAKPDISKMSEEEQKLISENTKKFLASITCDEARDLMMFNDEKSTKGEKVALENLQQRNPKVYEKHTAYMRNVFKTIGEEGAAFLVKTESLADKMRDEAAKGQFTTMKALHNEYKSLSAETREKIEAEYPIFRLEEALYIIYGRPQARG